MLLVLTLRIHSPTNASTHTKKHSRTRGCFFISFPFYFIIPAFFFIVIPDFTAQDRICPVDSSVAQSKTAQTSRPRVGFWCAQGNEPSRIPAIPVLRRISVRRNWNETEDALSSERRILGGIGGSSNTQFRLTFTRRPTTRACVFARPYRKP